MCNSCVVKKKREKKKKKKKYSRMLRAAMDRKNALFPEHDNET